MYKGITIAAAAAIVFTLISGCASEQSRKAEYQRATTLPPLEVPPDLTAPELQGSMDLPQAGAGQSYSTYSVTGGSAVTGVSVLPQAANMRVLRDGDMRWLEVQAPPEQLWSKLRDFWQQQGLEVKRDEPLIGIMETQWAENKADVPQDWLSKWLPKLHSAPTRDKFRVRLEPAVQGGATEVFITHYGVEEIQRGSNAESYDTVWQSRPADAELVNEMLNRLMVYFGAPQEKATSMIASAVQKSARARMEAEASGEPVIVVTEGFARTWRRVGIALDRLGLVVEDRDRSAGTYYVRSLDLVEDAGKSKPGFFSSLFSGKEDEAASGQAARIVVLDGGETCRVVVQNASGQRDSSEAAKSILKQLESELR